MTDLAINLERLGLEQYLDAFIEEGFDTWEILLDIQESDLEALGVKLGHRRKLQRAIADYRGIPYERLVGSPTAQDGPSDQARPGDESQGIVASREGGTGPASETKRKYRRHPKPDDNAPERPPSAYVLFSNRIREEVKSDNLSFTEIAKLVGDRWQKLEPSQKEPFESSASSLKEQYNTQLSAYKQTESYREYTQYLNDFKAKHGPQTDPKRPKLDPQSSGGSLSATSLEIPDTIAVTSGHGRVASLNNMGVPSLTSTISPPSILALTSSASLPIISGSGSRGLPSLHRANSPQPSFGRQPRLMGQLPNHSSAPDDSGQVAYDTLSRTAQLSLNTPPTGTPPLPPHSLGPVRSDLNTPAEGYSWPSRGGQTHLQQTGPASSVGLSLLGSGITLPSPAFPPEPWRERGKDWTIPMQTSPTTSVPHVPPVSFAPLLGPERTSDLAHSPVQRILPPLRHNALPGSTFQGSPSAPHLARQLPGEPERRALPLYGDSGGRHLDRNENEAASTLAGLAARPGNETPQSRSQNRSPP